MAIRPVLCCVITPFLILVIILLNNALPSMAVEEFKVGDDLGWRRPAINQTDLYNVWASRRKFHVGDLLRFEYYNDSVVKVDKWGYYHCNLSSPETVYTDGNNTLITLEEPGPLYFVSGDPDHCKDGQKLLVEVLPLYPPGSHSPPPIANPPESFWEMSPAPSPVPNSGSGLTISSVHGAVLILLALLVAALVV